MTNYELHRKDFEAMGINPKDEEDIIMKLAIRKDGLLSKCFNINCRDCIFHDKEGFCSSRIRGWLSREVEEPKEEKHMEIGDSVKIVEGLFNGCKGRIVDINMSMQFPYRVEVIKGDKKQEMFYNAEYISKIEDDNSKFKVGDKVVVIDKEDSHYRKHGIIEEIKPIGNSIYFNVHFNGERDNFYFLKNCLVIEKKNKKTPPRIVVYQNGNVIVAKDLETGEVADAKCSKEDKFDFNFGAFLAVSRLLEYDDVLKKIINQAGNGLGNMSEAFARIYKLLGEDIKEVTTKIKES